MRKLLSIAIYEFSRNVRRISYLLLTFGVPAFGLVATLIVRGTSSPIAQPATAPRIGYVDSSGQFGGSPSDKTFARYASKELATQALTRGAVDHYFVVPVDYLSSGTIALYNRDISLGGQGPAQEAVREFLIRGLVGNAVPPPQIDRLTAPPAFTLYQLDGHGAAESLQSAARHLLVANLFTLLLAVSIFSASQFLLQGVTEEKENRVIELLLSSVSPAQLMEGKILGLGALGLLQIGIWAVSARLLVPLASSNLQELTRLTAAPGTLGLLLLLFLMGYLFFAAMMTAIGAVASSLREGQQIAGLLATLSLVPVWFTGSLVNRPTSGLSRFLSYFPVTAPTALMQRLPTSGISGYELAAAIGVLAICIVLMTLAANRVFRMGLLLYGKRPSLRTILVALKDG